MRRSEEGRIHLLSISFTLFGMDVTRAPKNAYRASPSRTAMTIDVSDA